MSSLPHDKFEKSDGLNIILVDDDEIFLTIAKSTLKKICNNAEINCANSGEFALTLLQTTTPDVLFLDINMPVMSGWEFIENLKVSQDKFTFPICITSSTIDPGDKEKAKTSERVKFFIEKPINREKMSEALSIMLVDQGSSDQ